MAVEWFRNHYACTYCDVKWEDEWSCMCDDDCPQCNRVFTPEGSDDLSRELTLKDFRLVATRLGDVSKPWECQVEVLRQENGALVAGTLWISNRRAESYIQRALEKGESVPGLKPTFLHTW